MPSLHRLYVPHRTDGMPAVVHHSLNPFKPGILHHAQDHQHGKVQVTGWAGIRAGNRLIDALPARQRSAFLARCETVPLLFGERLGLKDAPIRHVHIPLTGFVSLVIAIDDHMPLELNIIGNEGLLGAEMVLDTRIAPYTSIVQGAGTALRLNASAFAGQLDSSPVLRKICNRYFHVLVEQLAQSIACNCFHEVSQRLARWLLMTHDRAGGKDLELTHAFLATMLGVRRSAVTIAAGNLQHQQLISYSRGQIRVLSRPGLEEASCECYAAGINAYERGLHMLPGNTIPGLSQRSTQPRGQPG